LYRVVTTLSFDDFWGGIAWGAAKRSLIFAIYKLGTKPKINNFDLIIVVDEYILRFEISMGNMILMKIVNSCDNLLKVDANLILGESESESAYFFYFMICLKSSPFSKNSVMSSTLF